MQKTEKTVPKAENQNYLIFFYGESEVKCVLCRYRSVVEKLEFAWIRTTDFYFSYI
jgi:hypothetical protein